MNTDLYTIREKGFRLLIEGLGAAGAIKFLQQLEPGEGNYTIEKFKRPSGGTPLLGLLVSAI